MKQDLIPGFSCVVTAPVKDGPDHLTEATEAGYPLIYIINSNNDKYLRRCFGRGSEGQVTFVQRKVTSIPGFTVGEVKDEDNFLPGGKIPMTMLWEVQKFFKSVIAKFGDTNLEAFILIMWNAERGYFLHVPDQKVAGAAVSYDPAALPPGCRIVVDIHSHANFGAFFSGTDDRDDKDTVRFSGVIGYNRRPDPEMKFRFNFLETKTTVQVTDIFDFPRTEVQDTPTDWLNKVQVITPTVHKNTYPTSGQHQGHYSGRGYVPPLTRKKYEAPMPSNATFQGYRDGKDIWYLKGGGYITMDQWEEDYPKVIAQQEAEEAEKAAQENGGQQGTRPLELTFQGNLESEKPSLSQKEQSGESLTTKSGQQSPSVVEKPGSNWNLNSSNSANSATQFHSSPFEKSFAREQTEQEMTENKTSNSQVPSTRPSSNQGKEPTTEPEPAKLTSTPSTTTPSNSTSTPSLVSSEVRDPLGIFTDKPKAYISQDVDGYSVLTLVDVKPPQAELFGKKDPEEEAFEREIERWTQGKAPEGVVPVEAPQLKQAREKTPTEKYRDQYLAGSAPLPSHIQSSLGTSEVAPLGNTFQAPALQARIPSLVRRELPTSGVSVDSWLERRARQARGELEFSVGSRITPISDRLEEKMHQRARQESLLQNEDDLDELQSGMPPFLVTTPSGGRKTINVWPDNTVTLRLERGDLPEDFDANCVGFGPEAAGAKAVVDALAPVLASSGTLLRQTAQSFFEQIEEDERLPMFRTLADSLPSAARESLERNGL